MAFLFIFQKQQNSLIAGLRATNEALSMPTDTAEETKNSSPDQGSEAETKENEPVQNKPKATNLPRSDSIGSSSGRKFLAPTLSDPAARPEKERIVPKKKNSRPAVINKNVVHLNDSENKPNRDFVFNKTTMPKMTNAMHEIRDWWNEQLACVSSSEED